jgi:hypothetical protein
MVSPLRKCKDVEMIELSQTSHVIPEVEIPNLGIIIPLYYSALTRHICSYSLFFMAVISDTICAYTEKYDHMQVSIKNIKPQSVQYLVLFGYVPLYFSISQTKEITVQHSALMPVNTCYKFQFTRTITSQALLTITVYR